MTVLATVLFAVLFFVCVMVSIALHEVGHLVPAKLFGVRVSKYFVGFGHTLWSTRRGETEYGVKLLPLGGYVRLMGMYPPQPPRTGREGRLTRMADQARAAEYEEITDADRGRLLYEKKTWQKIIVMLGGPVMNLLLAFVIFLGVTATYGYYTPTLSVAAVSECVIAADRPERTCTGTDPTTPAVEAGIKVGDRLVSFNGTDLTDWAQVGDLIRANRDGEARVTVERDGRLIQLPTVHTVLNHVPDRLDPSRTVEAGFFGVTPAIERRRGGPVAAAGQMWTLTTQSVVALASFPVRVFNVAADLVTGRPRDVNSPVSIIGASRVAGEIGASDQLTDGDKAASWLSLLGSVNLFLALFNLVPLLPLDGGHVAAAVWEWLRRTVVRLAGRPDPGPVDTARGLPVTYLVGGFLLLGGAILILADLISPLRLL